MEEEKIRRLEDKLKAMLENEGRDKSEPKVIHARGTGGNIIRRRKGKQDERI